MAFRFKYQNILKYRQDQEGNAKNNLAIAIQDLEKTKTKLELLQQQKLEYLQRRQSELQAGVTAVVFRNYQASLEYFQTAIEDTKIEISEAEKTVEQARKLLQEATQEKKKLEKVKEKALADYREEELRNENIFVDSLITYKSARKAEE